MSLALDGLLKKSEDKFYLKRAKDVDEKRKMTNYFNEVSRDVSKY